MKKRIAKLLSFVLALTLAVSAVPVSHAEDQIFDDDPLNWASPYINRAYEEGWVHGKVNDDTHKEFDPTGTVRVDEWCTLLSQMAYPGAAQLYPTDGNWSARHIKVMNDHEILSALEPYELDQPISREAMAQTMYAIAADKGLPTPTEGELRAAQAKLKDFNEINPKYQDGVKAAVAWGIINGTDEGKFLPTDSMTREQMAAMACKLYDNVLNRSLVGSISNEAVALSVSTHHWVTDYWSSLAANVRDTMDQDAFNCAAQTAADYWKIRYAGNPQPMAQGKSPVKNDRYNYACYTTSSTDAKVTNVTKAAQQGLLVIGAVKDAAGNYCDYFTVKDMSYQSDVTDKMRSVIQGITESMSERDVVLHCMKAVVDQLNYQPSGSASWTNGSKSGNSASYANMISQLLTWAGIPNIVIESKAMSRSWLLVRIDKDWYVVDGTMAESPNKLDAGIQTMEAYEKFWGADSSNVVQANGAIEVLRFRALADCYPARADMYLYTDSYF